MTKFLTYATIVICLGTTATLALSNRSVKLNPKAEALLAADGAFRDGLYLGKLAGEAGQPQRPAIGRWSTGQDRATFSAGYRRGYNEFLVSARVSAVAPIE